MSSEFVSLLVAISRLFYERTASQFCSQLRLTAPACQDDEKSCVKNESISEQGLHVFNWISVQLGIEEVVPVLCRGETFCPGSVVEKGVHGNGSSFQMLWGTYVRGPYHALK